MKTWNNKSYKLQSEARAYHSEMLLFTLRVWLRSGMMHTERIRENTIEERPKYRLQGHYREKMIMMMQFAAIEKGERVPRMIVRLLFCS